MKPLTSEGSIGYGNKSSEILPEYTEGDSGDYGGVEVVMGKFQVQPMPRCRLDAKNGSYSLKCLLYVYSNIYIYIMVC